MDNIRQTAKVIMAGMTSGNYMIRIETENGPMIEAILPPEEFAKAVTGKLAKGHLTES
jgi:hypothetical protein